MTAVFMTLTSSVLALSGTDYSDHTQKCELSVKVDKKDVTTFASLGWKENKAGLKSGQLAFTILNDRQDNDVDEDFWGYFGTNIAFYVQAASGSVSATNPRYSGIVIAEEYKPLTGSPGDIDMFDVSWETSGAVSRAVS